MIEPYTRILMLSNSCAYIFSNCHYDYLIPAIACSFTLYIHTFWYMLQCQVSTRSRGCKTRSVKENILYTEAWKKSYREKGNIGASNQIRAHGDPQTGRVSATDSRSNIWAQKLYTDDPVQKALGSRPLKKAAYIHMCSSWDWEQLDQQRQQRREWQISVVGKKTRWVWGQKQGETEL